MEDGSRAEMSRRLTDAIMSVAPPTLWGLGYYATEGVYTSAIIPNDGKWYSLRFAALEFNYHSTLRWELYNNAATNQVDVDFGTLHWTDSQP